MKIGIDARFWRKSTGGIGRYTRNLVFNLLKMDQKNEYFLFLTPDDIKECDLEAKNLKKIVVPIPHYTLAEQIKLPFIFKKYNLDLIHFTNFNHSLLYPGKFVVTIHDLTMSFFPVGRKQKSFLRRAAYNLTLKHAVKKASAVIAVSKSTKKDIVKHLGADPKKVFITYEGVEEEWKNSEFRIRNLESEKILNKYNIKKPYILFISQWRPHKNIERLIEAYEILQLTTSNQQLTTLQLVLGGKSDKEFPQIIERVEKAKQKFPNQIIIPGFVTDEDLPILYQNAEVFVFPSLYEGFGLPALEAMTLNCPVVASNTSCLPEILGNAAIYFDPYNPKDIADKIKKVLTDKNFRDNLRNKGKEQVKKYSWEKMAKETLEIYKKVARSKY